MELLALAIEEVGSTDPVQVALALEGSRYDAIPDEVWIRKDNHQLLQPMYISTFKKQGDEGVFYDVERTGIGPKSDFYVEAKDTALPTTCVMERP